MVKKYTKRLKKDSGYDSDSSIPPKPHRKWSCECDDCEEWIDKYFLLIHPEGCECKYCAFVEIKTRFFDY